MKRKIIEKEKLWKKTFSTISKTFNFKKNFLNAKKILDFGCGVGTFTNILAKKYPKIKLYGQEINKEKLQLAKKTYKRKNLKFKLSKTLKGKYNIIFLIFALHEIKNPNKVLKDLYKHLNKNGKIMIYDFKKTSKKEFKKLWDKGDFERSFEKEFKEHSTWSLKEFETMLKKANFKTNKLKTFKDYWIIYIGEK